jgi:hypothetical protein
MKLKEKERAFCDAPRYFRMMEFPRSGTQRPDKSTRYPRNACISRNSGFLAALRVAVRNPARKRTHGPLLGGVHAAACGLKMKGPRPLHASPRKGTWFVDSLGARFAGPSFNMLRFSMDCPQPSRTRRLETESPAMLPIEHGIAKRALEVDFPSSAASRPDRLS